jgi:type IV pilus assembly protein PilP
MRSPTHIGALVIAGLLLGGCGDSPAKQPGPNQKAPEAVPAQPVPPAGARAAARPGSTAAPIPSDLPPLPVRDINERDFAESPSNRDPFRSYADAFKAQNATKKVTVQREVLINKYALDELKIVGIVTGSAGRVLIDDPTGLGWVVKVGDFVGKPEVIHSGGPSGPDVPVNWRVDRIRSNDVVFVREDPSRPDVPSTTRTLSLRTPEELNPEIRTGVRGSTSIETPTQPEKGGT